MNEKKIVVGMTGQELVNIALNAGGALLDGYAAGKKAADEVLTAFLPCYPITHETEVKNWMNEFLTTLQGQKLAAYLPEKNAETGERYGYGSRQSQETAAGQFCKSLANRLQYRITRLKKADKAAQDEQDALNGPEFSENEQTAIDESRRMEQGALNGDEQGALNGDEQDAKQAAEYKAADLLTLLLNCPEMDKKKGTIEKWLKELSV